MTVSYQTSGEESSPEAAERTAFGGADASQERRLSHQPLHLTVARSGTSCPSYSQLVVLRDASLIDIQEPVWKRFWPDAGAARACFVTEVIHLERSFPALVIKKVTSWD